MGLDAILYKWAGILGIGAAIFALSYHYNKRFLDWLRFQSIGTRDYIAEKFAIMFIDIPPQRILMGQFALSFGLGSVLFLVFLPNLFPGILFGLTATVVGWKAPKPVVDWMYRRRIKKFNLQMVDALGLMSNGMKSGLSIVQTLGLVTKEMPDPIRQEFQLILNQNKLGVPLEEAFTDLSKRIVSDDVEMFVTAINILKETGGNLAETFDTIVNTIRERIRVEQKIDALTSQGFYQGLVVAGIPPILGFVFYQTDPKFMEPLFASIPGWIIVMMILALEVVGFFVILKVVKIQV